MVADLACVYCGVWRLVLLSAAGNACETVLHHPMGLLPLGSCRQAQVVVQTSFGRVLVIVAGLAQTLLKCGLLYAVRLVAHL